MENRNIRLRLPIQFSVQDRKDGLSCGEQLQSMMEDLEDDADGTKLEANCLVIGSFGRKEKGNEVLGHVPDHTLKKLAADVFIVKQRPECVPLPLPCLFAQKRSAGDQTAARCSARLPPGTPNRCRALSSVPCVPPPQHSALSLHSQQHWTRSGFAERRCLLRA